MVLRRRASLHLTGGMIPDPDTAAAETLPCGQHPPGGLDSDPADALPAAARHRPRNSAKLQHLGRRAAGRETASRRRRHAAWSDMAPSHGSQLNSQIWLICAQGSADTGPRRTAPSRRS